MRIKNIGFWWLTASIITLIFSPAIRYSFFQDDFFALVTAKINSLSDIWRLFRLIPEAVYWRPVGIQLYFGVMQFLGLGRPIWFHLVSLSVHLINTYLVYKLSAKVFAQERAARLTAFLWGISPIHYFALGWAVNFSFILVGTWSILAILAAGEGKRFRSILFLILGLMTNELAVVIPGLVILVSGRKKLGDAAAMGAVVAGYITWRMLSGVKIEGDYVIGWAAAASTLRWYGLWILGWSDIVRDYLTGFNFSAEFTKTFGAIVWIYVTELAAVMILLIRNRKRIFWLGLLWMLISLLPVLFFSRHLYSHYGAVAAIGIYWLAAEAVSRKRQWIMAAVIWLLVAIATLGLNYQVSWMADHARNSTVYQAKIRQQAENLDSSKIIYIVSGNSSVKTVLLKGWGVEYLLGVSRDKVIFVTSSDEVEDKHKNKIIAL
jgi:hypothetical protein